MAQDTDSIHAGHGKDVDETNEEHGPAAMKGLDAVYAEEGPGGTQPEDYDIQTVERVYRKLDFRIIPGMSLCVPSTYQSGALIINTSSLLGSVFPLLRHSLKHRHCSDDEQRRGA
jgi:hypothetical protein